MFLCYLKALSSLSCLIFPEVNSITINMKKSRFWGFVDNGWALGECRSLGELTKEKEDCGQGDCKSGKSRCEYISTIVLSHLLAQKLILAFVLAFSCLHLAVLIHLYIYSHISFLYIFLRFWNSVLSRNQNCFLWPSSGPATDLRTLI